MTDEEVLRRVCHGTTSRPDKLSVIYNDGRIALVKKPAFRVGNHAFRPERYSAYVTRYDTEKPKIMLGVWSGKEVWNCSREENGPLTFKRLVGLVESLGLHVQCIRVPEKNK